MRFCLFLFLLLLPAFASAQSTAQPTGTIAVTEAAGQDQSIAQRIREILAELDGYENTTVDVSAGIVTLSGSTLDTTKTAQLTDLISRVDGVVAIENNVTETTNLAERLTPFVDRVKSRSIQFIAFLPLLAVALVVFIGIVLLGLATARRAQPWNRLAPNAFIADIIRQIVRLVFIVGGLVVALDILGATALLSGILGAAGLVGLAIGFAVRDTVENFIASIMLSIRQPFRPNDLVEIEGDTGKVIRLTSRATILLSFDGNQIRIPNATVFKSRIVNFTRNSERRFTFELGMAPDTDFAAARSLALEGLNGLPFVLRTPEPGVWIETIGDSTISLLITAWIDQTQTDFNLARSEAIRQTVIAFDQAGYAMPEPGLRLLRDGAARGADQASSPAATVPTSGTPETPAPADEVDTSAEYALTRIVDQERAQTRSDLLSYQANVE